MQDSNPSIDLTTLAKQSMLERHLIPDFPPAVIKQIDQISSSALPKESHIQDLRQLLWFSLDNDESRDLDQITFAKVLDNRVFKIYIAIADVDSLVKKNRLLINMLKITPLLSIHPPKFFPCYRKNYRLI